MGTRAGSAAGLLLCWLALLLLSLLLRPLLPVDETRYIGVAWEMWQRGEFLVPWLNGEPYSHKPPLLFWLIHAGWWLFGVNEWWPRCVAALLSLAVLLAVSRLARLLWPGDRLTPRLVPWVLFGFVFWSAFYTWVQIDMLVVLATVLAMTGLELAGRGRTSGWLLCGVAIGAGALSKGPVILLHVLPVALLAPLWLDAQTRPAWRAWYVGLLASVAAGAAIGLAWAVPAAIAGGEAYAQAILWGQTAERLVDSFAHAQPWWWYLPWLPLLAAPWILLPWLWRHLWRRPRDAGERFCLVWLLAVIALASVVSGKQAKYLLPVLPAIALLLTHAMTHMQVTVVAQRPWLPALALLLAGSVLALLPGRLETAPWVAGIHPGWGLLLIVPAVALLGVRDLPVTSYVRRLALLSVAAVAIVQLALFPPAGPAYDLRQAGEMLARVQEEGRPVANIGKYHGQYHFHGRLRQRLIPLARGEAFGWASDHPDGCLVAYYEGPPPAHSRSGALHVQDYRGGSLAIWPGRTVAEAPEVLP
jgi:4-amino-4-deoxy-L-arabinose transferase-like glycosyltransferase